MIFGLRQVLTPPVRSRHPGQSASSKRTQVSSGAPAILAELVSSPIWYERHQFPDEQEDIILRAVSSFANALGGVKAQKRY
jgi:hypothetical protein